MFRNINKKVQEYIRDNELSDDGIDKIRREKLELFSLFDSESFKSARNRMNGILNQIIRLFRGYLINYRGFINVLLPNILYVPVRCKISNEPQI